MTALRDPGMDRPPDEWQSPEYDPGFPVVVPPDLPTNVDNPVGVVPTVDALEMHRETVNAIQANSAALARILSALTDVGKEIVRVDAGATVSQRIRFRVRWLIISRATAGVGTLLVGTGSYPFTVAAAPVRVDFPLVIERGVDVGFTGDGVLYLVGDPE